DAGELRERREGIDLREPQQRIPRVVKRHLDVWRVLGGVGLLRGEGESPFLGGINRPCLRIEFGGLGDQQRRRWVSAQRNRNVDWSNLAIHGNTGRGVVER